jgi:hypothetical protein
VSLIIIGVDPGDSTGVAMLKDTELFYAYQGDAGEAATLVELTIDRFRKTDTKLAVACERYVTQSRRGRTHQPTAQRTGGVIEHMCQKHDVPFRWQGPADAWAIANNDRLKLLGLLLAPGDVSRPDANDVNMAMRHALLYMSNTHATVFREILRKHGVVS